MHSDSYSLGILLTIHRHKATLYWALDGNYRLHQKKKNSDPNDVPLNRGNAYFVDEIAFKEYLSKYDDSLTHVSCVIVCLVTLDFDISETGVNVLRIQSITTTADGQIQKHGLQWCLRYTMCSP
jgi:hypothetical protein